MMFAAFFSRRKRIIFDNIIMYLCHTYSHFDLVHSCAIILKPRDTVTWSSLSVGNIMEVSITHYGGHITRQHMGNYAEDGSKKIIRKPKFFNNAEQTARRTTFSPPNFGDIVLFLTIRMLGGNNLEGGSIFSAEMRCFSIIKQCSYCTLAPTRTRSLLLHTPLITWYRHVIFI